MFNLFISIFALIIIITVCVKRKQVINLNKSKKNVNKISDEFTELKFGNTILFTGLDECGCESEKQFMGIVKNIHLNPNNDNYISLIVAELYDVTNNKEYYMFPASKATSGTSCVITMYMFEKHRLPNISFTYKDLIDNGILGSSLDRIKIKEVL